MNTVDALHHALALERTNRPGEAEAVYRQILAAQPGNVDALHLFGVLLYRLGRTDESIALLEKASRRAPRNVEILNNFGQILRTAGRTEEAEKKFRRAIAFQPDFADAHSNLGIILSARKQPDEAEACFRRALRIDPSHGPASYNLGTLLTEESRYAEAIPLFRRILAVRPDLADAHNNLGHALLETGEEKEAEVHFQAALSLAPKHADALANMGGLYFTRGEFADSERCYNQALAFNPEHPRALSGIANILDKIGRQIDALEARRRAHALNPAHGETLSALVYQLMTTCDWIELAPLAADLDERTWTAIAAGRKPPESPFLNICRSADPALNFDVARLQSEALTRRLSTLRLPPLSPQGSGDRQRIVLGYLSADFKNHPVGHLVSPLFRLHDRSRFEVRAYSAGPDDGSDYRKAFERNADAFVDIRTLADREAAERIRADGVDILIDLGGYTQGNRLGICALRPAPLAFSYVGFAGTVGSDVFDYTVVDPIVVPPANARFYSEKLVVVPPCYLIHDRDPVAERRFTRAEEGLPEQAFVFCSFNEARKLTAPVFEAWVDLLEAVPDGVLWLIRSNDLMAENLTRIAATRGLDPGRLIFAIRRPKPEHLARLSLADLALDTMPFNGGVTTSDALWAGVPLVAARGTNCASLGSASKLVAVGLPELIADDLAGAMALTRKLAADRDALAAVRNKLAANRLTAPLFDGARFVRTLEQGYAEAFRLFQAGKPTRHIVLDDSARGLY